MAQGLRIPYESAEILDVEGSRVAFTSNSTDLRQTHAFGFLDLSRNPDAGLIVETDAVVVPRIAVIGNDMPVCGFMESAPGNLGLPSRLAVYLPEGDGFSRYVLALGYATNPQYMDLIAGPSGRLRAVFDVEGAGIQVSFVETLSDLLNGRPVEVVAPGCDFAGGMLRSAWDSTGRMHLAYVDRFKRLFYHNTVPQTGENMDGGGVFLLEGEAGDGCNIRSAEGDGHSRRISGRPHGEGGEAGGLIRRIRLRP